jgi:hypothetical protein
LIHLAYYYRWLFPHLIYLYWSYTCTFYLLIYLTYNYRWLIPHLCKIYGTQINTTTTTTDSLQATDYSWCETKVFYTTEGLMSISRSPCYLLSIKLQAWCIVVQHEAWNISLEGGGRLQHYHLQQEVHWCTVLMLPWKGVILCVAQCRYHIGNTRGSFGWDGEGNVKKWQRWQGCSPEMLI